MCLTDCLHLYATPCMCLVLQKSGDTEVREWSQMLRNWRTLGATIRVLGIKPRSSISKSS